MKINESTLITYATSSSCPTDKEGWLHKRGEVNKNFQKRYFVLKGNLLFYFDKRFDKEPIGVIILEGCTIELADEEQEMCAFKIVFHGEGRRTYYLGADSQATVEEWMKFTAASSYDYMKLIVMELQQKLVEQEELEKLQAQQQLSLDSNMSAAPMATSRPNPFNKADTLSHAHMTSAAAGGVATAPGPTPNSSSWAQIHSKHGTRIACDRDKWCRLQLQK